MGKISTSALSSSNQVQITRKNSESRGWMAKRDWLKALSEVLVVIVNGPNARREILVYFQKNLQSVLYGSRYCHADLTKVIAESNIPWHVAHSCHSRTLRLWIESPVLETEKGEHLENWKPIKVTDTSDLPFDELRATRQHLHLALVVEVGFELCMQWSARHRRVHRTRSRARRWVQTDGGWPVKLRTNLGDLEFNLQTIS